MNVPISSETYIWVKITTQPSNINFSTSVSLNGEKWNVVFSNNYIRAESQKTYPLPQNNSISDDRAIENVMNRIVGHIRNLGYFSMELDMKWGYEGGYGGVHVYAEGVDIFPSIHQNSSAKYSEHSLELAERIIKDIRSSRKKGLKTMLNYWRRAKELDNLGFDSEAYLNYFKVIECLSELNNPQYKTIVERFSPGGIPQKTLCKKYRVKREADKRRLNGQICFVAKALSAAGSDSRIRRGFFMKVLDIVYIRHYWNVAHKLFRSNPYDSYDAIGQHSDEFSLVMIENTYISIITQLLVLLYVKPGQYGLSMNCNMPVIVSLPGKDRV